MTVGKTVQVWRLSDLSLLRTVSLPPGPRGEENLAPYEARFVHAAGSQTIFVNCVAGNSLYVSRNLASPDPEFRLVYDFGKHSGVAYPALTHDDRYYLQPLTDENRLVLLDVHDPLHPKPVSELHFDHEPADPARPRQGHLHYLTLDLDERRAAASDYVIDIPPTLTFDGDRRVYLLQFDPQTGKVSFNLSFRDEFTGQVGVDFNREVWFHGKTGAARPHGTIFLP